MDLGFFAYNLIRISKENDNRKIKPETNTSVLIDKNGNADDLRGINDFDVVNPSLEALGLVMNIINRSGYSQKFKFEGIETPVTIPNGSVHQLAWTGHEWKNLTAPAVGKIVECYPGENLEDLYPLTKWEEVSDYNGKFAKVGTKEDAVTGNAEFPAITGELHFEDEAHQSVIIDLKGVSTKTDKSSPLQVITTAGALKGVVTSTPGDGEKIDGVSGFKLNLTKTANDIFVENATTLVPDWYKISLMRRIK